MANNLGEQGVDGGRAAGAGGHPEAGVNEHLLPSSSDEPHVAEPFVDDEPRDGELARRATARELAIAFEVAERKVRAAFAQIVEAEEAVNAAFLSGGDYPSIKVSACGSRYNDDFKDVDETIEIMTRAAWRAIVDRLELRRFMSIRAYEEMTKALDQSELPPITTDNVLRFAHDHLARARGYLKEAVDEVFNFLRPRGHTRAGQLKTNSQLEVPPKVILDYMVQAGYGRGRFRVNYHYSQHLTALENVFNAVGGKGEINKRYRSVLEDSIDTSETGEGETELFRWKGHKNGALHIWFKRLELLKRLNEIAGGARLRPAQSEDERLRAEIAKARAENERLKREAARQGEVP